MNETFHFGLQTPPSELDGDQFVRTHVGAVCLQLVLEETERSVISCLIQLILVQLSHSHRRL